MILFVPIGFVILSAQLKSCSKPGGCLEAKEVRLAWSESLNFSIHT